MFLSCELSFRHNVFWSYVTLLQAGCDTRSVFLKQSYIQSVLKRCLHTSNNCKPSFYHYLFHFQHVKEFNNILLSFCHCRLWIESNHWKWMHANTEGIVSWCLLLHRFALSAVSGPEWTSIWEMAVTKRQKDDLGKCHHILVQLTLTSGWSGATP